MVYAHFLIFAQFAWIELLRARGITSGMEKACLAVMALAGIGAGFWVARMGAGIRVLRVSFFTAAAAAAYAPWAGGMPAGCVVSLVCGASIGVMTVCLASFLPRWCSVAWVGLGTGVGYALCNLPVVFAASPAQQALAGAAFAFAGGLLLPLRTNRPMMVASSQSLPRPLAIVCAFTAIVWLDSAAFFVIQHSSELKAGTWGNAMLWRNAALHLAAAVFAGFLLRHRLGGVMLGGWAVLSIAALAAGGAATLPMAGWAYPVGVSLYSTALVAWPGYFSTGDSRLVTWRAAWVYGIAGWFGSANGIGMVQTLKHVPAGFVVATAIVVLGSMSFRHTRWRSSLAAVVTGVVAWIFDSAPPAKPAEAVARGRQVYVSEGCINCHSRFVRPKTEDELLWGPPVSSSNALGERPVLIGNRRHGPDLTNVGLRRSATWLKLHFLDPRELSPGSAMPAYPHLFNDRRGDDLIAYLQGIPEYRYEERRAQIDLWSPQIGQSLPEPRPLFDRYCAVCHGFEGHGDGRLSGAFAKAPTNLDLGPFVWTPEGLDLETRIARVAKFGIPGTDMPGHEMLTDREILSIARYLKKIRESSR